MQKYNIFVKFQFNVDFFKYIAQRLVAWRQLGIWLVKCIDLRLNFQVQNQLYSLPETPIAPNRCCAIGFLFNLPEFCNQRMNRLNLFFPLTLWI
jgi:hypothetical protein